MLSDICMLLLYVIPLLGAIISILACHVRFKEDIKIEGSKPVYCLKVFFICLIPGFNYYIMFDMFKVFNDRLTYKKRALESAFRSAEEKRANTTKRKIDNEI